jgi:signal transduction histidine kinase
VGDGPGARRQLADLELLVGGGYFDHDVAAGTVEWSAGIRRMYGVLDDGVPGDIEAWLALVHPGDRDPSRDAIVEAFRTQGSFDFDHRFRRQADGTERWAHCRGFCEGAQAGRTDRVFGVTVDITERRRADAVLNGFIANAAHELRTPAAAIGQAVHALRLPGREDDRELVLDILARQANRLRTLTGNLVDLGRLEL